MVAADMALAGITSRIPCDEVIDAMYKIGQTMPVALRETAQGRFGGNTDRARA